ncbi:MAG: hypothetical protein WC497_04830 [Patescibacteria group bacterium]
MRTALLVVLLLAVLTGVALADQCRDTGVQLQVVAIGDKPLAASGTKAIFIGEYLKIPSASTGGEIYFATVGVKQPLPHDCWVQPAASYLGGWYAKHDASSLALTAGAKAGPVYLTLDFKRFSAVGNHRTKFWYHTVDWKFNGPADQKAKDRTGEYTVGIHFNKVDQSERWGLHLANQLKPHIRLEARYYRVLYGDDPVQYFRAQLAIS